MLMPRIIPCLLLSKGALVKTSRFSDPRYVGDPINAVKILNEKEVDELLILDIDATVEGREPNYNLIASLAKECRMPFCYGGGIKTADQMEQIISLGVEKVALGSAAVINPNLIAEGAFRVGSQSIVVVIDVKKDGLVNPYEIYTHNGRVNTGLDPIKFAKQASKLGAGEILVNSIDQDGIMSGYDYELAKCVSMAVDTPVTILGGAGSIADIENLIDVCGDVGAAAGSIFVFKGKFKAVLIQYLDVNEKALISARWILRNTLN